MIPGIIDSKKRKNLSLIYLGLYVLISVTPLLISTFTLPRSPHSILNEVAQSFAFTAIGLYVFQLIIAIRLKFLDRVFGLDRIFSFHRKMGVFIFLLILAHPILLSIDNEDLLFLFDPENPWYIWVGLTAVILLSVHILLSIYRKSFNISWETWRTMHDILGLGVLALALVHSWFISSDTDNPILAGIWILIPIVAGALFIWHRWGRYNNKYGLELEVIEVVKETEEVNTVKLKPANGQTIYQYLPGQWHFVRFFSEAVSDEEHHFTISSSPTQDFMSSSIKGLGDFTSSLGKLKPGDKAFSVGPFGQFSYPFYNNKSDLVFIAGGVGITPLMSMIKHKRDTHAKTKVLLLYGNDSEEDIIFNTELKEIEQSHPHLLKVVHFIQNPQQDWTGEKGKINKDKIKMYCGENLKDKQYYICGPASLIEDTIKVLENEGVAKANFHSETFALAEDFTPNTPYYREVKTVSNILMAIFLVISIFIGILRGEGIIENPVQDEEDNNDSFLWLQNDLEEA